MSPRPPSTPSIPTYDVPPAPGFGGQQVLGWLGVLVLVAVIMLGTTQAGSVQDLADLSGPWQAHVVSPVVEDKVVELPAIFERAGLDPDAHVKFSRNVELPADGTLRSVWIENPQYAARVTWDDVILDSVGDPDSASLKDRTDVALLVDLPAAPGIHTLGLEIRGDLAEGGVTGRMFMGPRSQLRSLWLRADAEKLGLALMLSLMGILHLGVATRSPKRPSYLYFGLLAATLGIWSFCHSDASFLMFEDLVMRVRIRRVTSIVLGPIGLGFVLAFLRLRRGRAYFSVVAVGAFFALLALTIPPEWLYTLEKAGDALLLFCIGCLAAISAWAVYKRIRWSFVFLLAMVPAVAVGALGEIFVSHGLMHGSSVMFSAVTLFIGASSVMLAIRHADDAERHERLANGSVDAIVSSNRAGVLSDVNPAAAALFGANAAGRSLLDWVKRDDIPSVKAHLLRGQSTIDRIEFRILRRGREVIMDSIATPLDASNALVVLRDVTVRRKMDEGMLQAARMEMVGLLAGGIAHDFNNMLGTLLAQVGYLQVTLPEGPENRLLGRMERTIDRASALSRRLLTIARGTSADPEATAMLPVARGAAELVEATLPKDVKLHVTLPPESLHALAVAADLEQVIVNLLVNARDAGAKNLYLRVLGFHVGNARGVAIIVDDDGPGVPNAIKEEIFQPFVTTKAPNKGSGLGLAVSHTIVRDCGGRLWVEDRPGGGARFIAALRHVDAAEDTHAPLPEGRRVLLVEDEEDLLEMYTEALREAGYFVEPCANGEAAIASLRQRSPDILVTDFVMMGVGGLQVARTSQELYRDRVPVLIVSGFIPADAMDEIGASDWHRLDKPARPARLVATVGRIGRRQERTARGETDITDVNALLPSFEQLTSAQFLQEPPA